MICYVLNFLVLSNFLLIDITFWINGMPRQGGLPHGREHCAPHSAAPPSPRSNQLDHRWGGRGGIVQCTMPTPPQPACWAGRGYCTLYSTSLFPIGHGWGQVLYSTRGGATRARSPWLHSHGPQACNRVILKV
jgi:hypothetical protein